MTKCESFSKESFIESDKFENTSLIIDNLLKNYDLRLRPNFGCIKFENLGKIFFSRSFIVSHNSWTS